MGEETTMDDLRTMEEQLAEVIEIVDNMLERSQDVRDEVLHRYGTDDELYQHCEENVRTLIKGKSGLEQIHDNVESWLHLAEAGFIKPENVPLNPMSEELSDFLEDVESDPSESSVS